MPTTRARSANAAAQGQINEQENLQPQNPVEEGEVREAQAEQTDLPDQGRYSGNGNRDRYNRPQAHSAVRINPGLEGRFQASIKACTSNKAKPMNI
ncbi:hypothetical protein THAOC_23516 [Thalassiosira oceanica]|uniref:Uncharacterized protein n=1 Tax=Thalassiosira oceanica TaxID=159749 RepID=K0RUA7_THAOC|nr:hypothetical protein THAOC_23516 [Thalassiosira oceanica]|eukprot:EJK56570.1 hypothetical protein THAOC_23516 [Thalassiosira oceanica]